MIQLIAIDLDGTLLDSRKRIDPQTVAILRRHARQGCRFAFCSGRSENELFDVLAAIPFFPFAILCNGAYVAELPSGAPIHAEPLAAADVRRIYAALSGFDMLFELCYHDRTVSERSRLARVREYGVTDLAPLVRTSRTAVEDIGAFLAAQTAPIGKVNIFFRTTGDRNRALRAAACLPYVVSHQEPTNLEFNQAGVHKGAGLRWLAGYLGLGADAVAAIGDNNNDLDMLRYAGTAVAMENAIPAVKAAADFITRSNDEGGVGRAVERLRPGPAAAP